LLLLHLGGATQQIGGIVGGRGMQRGLLLELLMLLLLL